MISKCTKIIAKSTVALSIYLIMNKDRFINAKVMLGENFRVLPIALL